MIFTICDASANSVATIAKVTLTKLSLGRSISIDNFCSVKSTRRNRNKLFTERVAPRPGVADIFVEINDEQRL
jgi:hypothetical protein